MVSFTSTVAIALATAATMVQAKGGFNFSPSLQLGRRAVDAIRGTSSVLARDDSELEFAACQSAAAAISPKPTFIIYSNRTVDVAGLPEICITQVNAHNAKSNIAELNKWEGWVYALNSTAVQTSGAGNGLTAYLETIAVNVS